MRRCRAGLNVTQEESQAMVGVLSTQLWHHQFIESALFMAPLPVSEASVLLSDTNAVDTPINPTIRSHAEPTI